MYIRIARLSYYLQLREVQNKELYRSQAKPCGVPSEEEEDPKI